MCHFLGLVCELAVKIQEWECTWLLAAKVGPHRPGALCSLVCPLLGSLSLLDSGVLGIFGARSQGETPGCNNGIGGLHKNLVTFRHPKMPDL